MQNFEENKPLFSLTTMRVGGPARFFLRAETVDDLYTGILFAKEKGMPFFILGGGSNIVVGDRGFPGLVIKMDIRGVSFEGGNVGKTSVVASAGEPWDDVVKETVEKGLFGVENLSFIPGTIGAAPIQNIGAYGVEVGDFVEWVEVFDTERMAVKKLTREECSFSYRDSVFKRDEGKSLIVLRVGLLLKRSGLPNIDYKDIQEYLRTQKMKDPTLADMRDIIITIRKSKLPDWNTCGTVGSFFKNPIISAEKADELKKRFPDMPLHPTHGGIKIPIAWILDHVLLWKGKRDGAVGVFSRHSLAIVNHGGATAADVAAFAKKIQQDVLEKTGISIVPEVSYVGEF